MALPEFARARAAGAFQESTERNFDNVESAFETLRGVSLLDGRRIADVSITGGSNTTVNHGLGRDLVGWFVTDKDTIADYPSKVSSDDKTLVVTSTSNQTIDLWVF